jgi:hypothetical protein
LLQVIYALWYWSRFWDWSYPLPNQGQAVLLRIGIVRILYFGRIRGMIHLSSEQVAYIPRHLTTNDSILLRILFTAYPKTEFCQISQVE